MSAECDGRMKEHQGDGGNSFNSPFNLQWIFGHNYRIPILNLTKNNDHIIIGLASSYISTIYEITTKKHNHLFGHEHEIITMKCDKSGRFVITADKKTVNCWDRSSESVSPIIIRSIENEKTNISAIGFSYDGKYLVSVDEENNLKFWLWTFGREKPDAIYQLPIKFGPVQNINFSRNILEYTYFVVTMKKSVVFGNWNTETNELFVHIPKVNIKKKKLYNDSSYIQESRKVISVTDYGEAIIFCDVLTELTEIPITNNKEYVKTLKIRNVSINVIVSVDNVIVIGDDSGEIRIFDKEMKFLYWFETVKFNPIYSISFHLNKRSYKIEDPQIFSPKSFDSKEVLFKETIPLDATNNPLILRNFIVGTKIGEICLVDFLNNECEYILYKSESYVTAFDTHPKKSWLCVGNSSGRISIYNFENKIKLCDLNLPNQNDDEEHSKMEISCVKYSKSGNHLACGLENGQIFMLNPVILTPIFNKPIHYTSRKIEQIIFSDDSNYLAYSDSEFRVFLLYFEIHWIFLGKYKYHYQPISALLFIETDINIPRFLSIGEDQMLVEYEIHEDGLQISYDLRIEQSAVPLTAILIPTNLLLNSKTKSKYIIVTTNDQYKIKTFDSILPENILNTFVGPLFDKPIRQLKLLSKANNLDDNFFVFCTDNVLGLQMLPIDGNQYKSLGFIGHPTKIKNIELSHDLHYVFSVGEDDNAVMMWKMNTILVKENYNLGGKGLEPFCSSLPGGKSGWLFRELQDLVYYIQILCKGIDYAKDRKIIDYIPITEVIDFMRGIGFFPTDFEIHNMIAELTRILPGEIIPTEISFESLVKLFINHKPVEGVNLKKLTESLVYISTNNNMNDETSSLDTTIITKEKIIEILTTVGEEIDETLAVKYLKELILPFEKLKESTLEIGNEEDLTINEIMDLIPDNFTITEFINNVLGINLENLKQYNKIDPSEFIPQIENKLAEMNIHLNSEVDDEEMYNTA